MAKLDWSKVPRHRSGGTSERLERQIDRAADSWLKPERLADHVACPICEKTFKSVASRQQHIAAAHGERKQKTDRKVASPKTAVATGPAPMCPTCGKPAELTQTRYGMRADCCGLHSWGLKPLVCDATMGARQKAHANFDPIWQSGAMKRRSAYARLAELMGLVQSECHIAQMTAEQAARVVEIVRSGAIVPIAPDLPELAPGELPWC